MHPIRVAVIGAGYWGSHLVRNFGSDSCDVMAACDREHSVPANDAAGLPEVETLVDRLLTRVDAAAVATPASSQGGTGLKAVEAGKHVLVEKPLQQGGLLANRHMEVSRELRLHLSHAKCLWPSPGLQPYAASQCEASHSSGSVSPCNRPL